MQNQDALTAMIEPISVKNIEKMQELLKLVFPYCKSRKYPPEQSVYLSLINDKNYFIDEKIINEEFFVAIDGQSVTGTTGLTLYQHDNPLCCWLGWFCVDPFHRGRNIGKRLLEWTLNRAQSRGFKNLKVETSDHENEAGAQLLYDSLGIKVFGTKPAPHIGTGENIIIYREIYL